MKTKRFQGHFHSGSALSSAVEHFLHTEGVAGSNPAARTIFGGKTAGRVAEWLKAPDSKSNHYAFPSSDKAGQASTSPAVIV